jgi:hypothetical protein
MENNDPFGFVGKRQQEKSRRVEPMIIIARPGQEIRIIVEGEGSGHGSYFPLGDYDYASPSPSPDYDYASPSPSPDYDYASPSPSPDYGYPETM